ncbi:hypothetical protein F5884DRAFT_901453 [Xylogone sp. PMI_703]|nr:hypothetical protein F5884DRAFT_901453 [Xylogone sp. PMI_703]
MGLKYHADHIGSLLRPHSLLNALNQRASGAITEDEYKLQERGAISEAIKLQLDAGFSCVNDGEYSRENFWGSFFASLGGFSLMKSPPPEHFRPYFLWGKIVSETGTEPGQPDGMSIVCKSKIQHVRSAYLEEIKQLQSLLIDHPQVDYKLTMISPTWHHIMYKPGKAYCQSIYTSDEDYFADIILAYREEISILYEAGVRNVQIDVPEYSFFLDANMRAALTAEGVDPDVLLKLYIGVLNQCIEGRASDLHVGVHICRGNVESQSFVIGGYEGVADLLFRIDADTFLLEYDDTTRSGNFGPLASLPPSKNVVLGLVTTKSGHLEDIEELKGRVFEAARIMSADNGSPLEETLSRIGVSPQCGFATTLKGNHLTKDEMAAKLVLVNQLGMIITDLIERVPNGTALNGIAPNGRE